MIRYTFTKAERDKYWLPWIPKKHDEFMDSFTLFFEETEVKEINDFIQSDPILKVLEPDEQIVLNYHYLNLKRNIIDGAEVLNKIKVSEKEVNDYNYLMDAIKYDFHESKLQAITITFHGRTYKFKDDEVLGAFSKTFTSMYSVSSIESWDYKQVPYLKLLFAVLQVLQLPKISLSDSAWIIANFYRIAGDKHACSGTISQVKDKWSKRIKEFVDNS